MGFSIPLQEEYARVVPGIRAKLDHIDLIFFNLIGNAFKYGARYSKIIFNIRRDDVLTFFITNYGNAWKNEEHTHLFEQQFRASNSGSMDEGSGLGLFVVKTIAEAYGITVQAFYPVKLSKYNLPVAKYWLARCEPGRIGLTSEHARRIEEDMNNLTDADRENLFVDFDSKRYEPPENIGPFFSLWITEIPTYRISFAVTIPRDLFL